MKFILIFVVTMAFVVAIQAVPMRHTKRRFGQEHTPEADKTYQDVKDVAKGTDKEEKAGDLSGAMVRALLAKAPVCEQQRQADNIIDLGQEFGGEKEQQMIEIAKRYRQLERNTPGQGQPSELCTKTPRHKELEGLVQAQDPTEKEDPPAVKRGDDGENVAATNPVGGVEMPKIQREKNGLLLVGL